MKPAASKPTQNCWKIFGTIRLFFVALLSLAVVVGQASPMQASRLALGDSGWIEICGGEDGSYFIKAELEGGSPDPSHDCENCSLCAVTGSSAKADLSISHGELDLSLARGIAISECFLIVADCPEKSWTNSRAPPVESASHVSTLLDAFLSNQFRNDLPVGAGPARLGTS